MMIDEFLTKASQLLAAGEPFVTASVVRFQAPISGKPGDKAIIFADGKMWGWIGGGCAQPVVIREALKALADGRPRLVRISPESQAEDGIVDYTVTCHSGGTLDVYIEPVLPKPHILILGRSAIAQTLARLGKAIGYRVSVFAAEADAAQFPGVDSLRAGVDLSELKITPETFIVVSTQGEGDEEALEQAVKTHVSYVALVASKVKALKVLEYLRERAIPLDRINQVHAPAGLDIGAASPEEIAVSILAEIIEQRSKPFALSETKNPLPVPNLQAKDPVCGMLVDVATAKYRSEHHGSTVYFCCGGCRLAFEKDPKKYAVIA
jgi:xanthine dehydrogenase accessory factor